MSEKTEKLVNIILPDLLNYLEMVESGEIIDRRLKKELLCEEKEEKEKTNKENLKKTCKLS